MYRDNDTLGTATISISSGDYGSMLLNNAISGSYSAYSSSGYVRLTMFEDVKSGSVMSIVDSNARFSGRLYMIFGIN